MSDLKQLRPLRRPRLKRNIEPIVAPKGDFHLMRANGEDIRIPNPTAEQRRLLASLDGTRSVPQLEAEFGAKEVRDSLADMREWSLLEDAADEDGIPEIEKQRLDRQFRYFSDVAQDDGPSPSECQNACEMPGLRYWVRAVSGAPSTCRVTPDASSVRLCAIVASLRFSTTQSTSGGV